MPSSTDTSPSPIKADEHVLLFPAHGWRGEDGGWKVEIHAWVFEPEEDDLLRRALLRAITGGSDLDAAEDARARARLSAFLVDNERGKRLRVAVAGVEHALPASDKDGHAIAEVALPASAAAGVHTMRVVLSPGDERAFEAPLVLAEPEGTTIVSDIDDT